MRGARWRGGASILGWSCAVAACLGLPAQAHALPRAVIVSGPQGETTSRTGMIEFKASSPTLGATFECRVDGGGWGRCRSPHALGQLTLGGHAFTVKLVGVFTDQTPELRTWTVVDPAPEPAPQPAPSPVARVAPAGKGVRPSARRDARGCAYAGNVLGEVSTRRLAAATLCLLNGERRRHGLPALAANGRLALAARRHAGDMVSRRYFAHTSRSGSSVTARVRRAGYLRGVRRWFVGEILAWRAGRRATPLVALRMWLHSPGHRALVLEGRFRDAGVGIVAGAPRRGQGRGATFTVDFGRRS